MKLERKFNALSDLLAEAKASLKLANFNGYNTEQTAVGVLKIDDPDTIIAIDLSVDANKDLTVTIKDRYEESAAFEISKTFESTTPYSGTFLVAPLETYYHGDDGSVNIELRTTTATNLAEAALKVNVFKIEL